MAGYNASIYMKNREDWVFFKEACKKQGKNPNSVLRFFISDYSNRVHGIAPLEKEIAIGMAQAKKIARGKMKGKKASDLLKEI